METQLWTELACIARWLLYLGVSTLPTLGLMYSGYEHPVWGPMLAFPESISPRSRRLDTTPTTTSRRVLIRNSPEAWRRSERRNAVSPPTLSPMDGAKLAGPRIHLVPIHARVALQHQALRRRQGSRLSPGSTSWVVGQSVVVPVVPCLLSTPPCVRLTRVRAS